MAELLSDLTLITAHDPDAVAHLAWPAFQRATRDRAYGREALLTAWAWFRGGWDAKIRQLEAAATEEWCNAW